MGQQPGPSPEELEFIFEGFTRGLSDREVLDEMQDTEFPLRNPRFMRDRRRELNAARTVLEVTLKQQTDPLLVKARDEHLKEIRALIEKWKSAFTPGPPHDCQQIIKAYDNLPSEVYFLERNLLFGSLREHLRDPSIWQEYSNWKDIILSCKGSLTTLADKIRKEGESWPNVIKLGKDFETYMLDDIYSKMMHFEIDDEIPWGPDSYNLAGVAYKGGKSLALMVLDNEGRPAAEILIAEHPEDYIQAYRTLATKILNSEQANNVFNLLGELWNSKNRVYECLERTLLSRHYVATTCSLCPEKSP